MSVPQRCNYWKQVTGDQPRVLSGCASMYGVSRKHICFPPCLNRCRHRARLRSQRAFQRSWPRLESWPPASSEPPLSSGWRKSRSTPRCWGGSGRRIRPRRTPDGRETHDALRGWKRKSWVKSFHSCSVYKKTLIFKRMSWCLGTIVLTLVIKKQVFRVRTMTFVWTKAIISGLVCLYPVNTTVNPRKLAQPSDLKNF